MSELDEFRRMRVDAPMEVLLRSAEWQPLVRFMDRWYCTPLSSATGVNTVELDAAERQAGRSFPPAMREWYRLFGAHECLRDESSQDYEMPLARVGESPRWLLLFGENQEGWHCGVLDEHRDLADPPVYFEEFAVDPVGDWGYHPDELLDGRFIRLTSTLTSFVFGMTLRQAVIRLEPSPFMQPGVCGATFRGRQPLVALRERRVLRKVLAFPAGYDPEYDGQEVVLIDEWGFIVRTPVEFQTVSKLVRSSGRTLETAWRAR